MDLQESLKTYIKDELTDYQYYKQLAEDAPDPSSKQILCDMANDNMRHAEEFKVIYHGITGEIYNPQITRVMQRRPYRDALQDRILNEGYNYRRYMSHYNRSRGIGDALLLGALFGAGNDRLLNSITLLYLLNRR